MYSIKNISLISLGVLVVTASGYFLLTRPKYQPLDPNFPRSQFTSHGVINSVIQLKIKAEPLGDSGLTDIKVALDMPFDFNNSLHYKWKLSPGVEITEGTESGEFSGYVKGESKILVIRVRGFSKDSPHQVGFEAYAVSHGRKIYGDTIIASDAENTFENVVQNVEKIKESQ